MKLSLFGLVSLVGLVKCSSLADLSRQLGVTDISGQARLLDKCCQIGKERAIESVKSNCKLNALDEFQRSTGGLVEAAQLARDPNRVEQCELIMETCCIGFHRNKNCDSGKSLAKSGASCMDVELAKESGVATESFNDCCMSCSLGVLAARNNNRTSQAGCRLLSPLASSLSGQLYEQTYTECCLENLPKPSGALFEPGSPIDCRQANPCAQRCLPAGSLDPNTLERVELDRCDCFSGYKLGPDAINCQDIDECKTGSHSCNRLLEVCDNTRGSFRCLARRSSTRELALQQARAFIFE